MFRLVSFAVLATLLLASCQSVPREGRIGIDRNAVPWTDHLIRKNWIRVSVTKPDGSMLREAAIKVKWRNQGTDKMDLFMRLQTGWIGVPKGYVKFMADRIATDFCAAEGNVKSLWFVDHSEKVTHTSIVAKREAVLSDRFFTRVHHFVYQCGA